MATLNPQLLARFSDLAAKDCDQQCEQFLKTFIFALGDDWTGVSKLCDSWKKYLKAIKASGQDIDLAQAADFFQKNSTGARKEGTGAQRREELRDIDVDANNRITFAEYLLLHYKGMVLKEYYKRLEQDAPMNLDDEEVVANITGKCNELVEQLFTTPNALDPAMEEAIENFTQAKKARSEKMKHLQALAEKGGVKGMAAGNELAQMEAGDHTELNRMEVTLNAAKRLAVKKSGELMLEKKKKEEEARLAKEKEDAKARLKAKAALWS